MRKGGGGILLVILLCLYFNFGSPFFSRRRYWEKSNLWSFFGIYVKGFAAVILGETWVNFFLIRRFSLFLGVPGLYGAYRKLTRREPLSKGHMNPAAINTFDVNSLEATFTLTNAVPQYIPSNSGPWKIFEANIRRYAKETCGSRARNGTLYLLTGTSEYDMEGIIADNGNVNVFHSEVFLDDVKLAIPRALWTAGCCVWRDSNHTKDNRAESFAVMTNNAKDSNCLNQTEMSVSQVEKHLTPRGWPLVNLFPGEESCRHTENDARL